MRTLELPDELVHKVEKRARESGSTFEEFTTRAIEAALDRSDVAEPAWLKHYGFLADYPEETARINRVVEEEFGKIEPEMWK